MIAMSSDKKSSKRGAVIISRLLNKSNKLIAEKYRKLDDKKGEHFPNFLHEMINSNPGLEQSIGSGELYMILRELYFIGKVRSETLRDLDGTGCEWVVIDKDEVKKMRKGVYIKISLNSGLSQLKKFIGRKEQGSMLQYLHDQVKYKANPNQEYNNKKTRQRVSIYEKSNQEIMRLRRLSAHELSLLSGLDKRLKKDEHIAVIQSKNGRRLTSGAVRKIVQRYKDKVQKL